MMFDRPLGLLQRLQSDAEAVLGIGIVRLLVARSTKQAHRLVDATTLQQDEAKIVKGIEMIVVLPERPSIERFGLVGQPLLVEGECRPKRLWGCVSRRSNRMAEKVRFLEFVDH